MREHTNGASQLPKAYFPLDSGSEFDNDYSIVDWLTQYSEEKDANLMYVASSDDAFCRR